MSIYLKGHNTLTGNDKYPKDLSVYFGPLPTTITTYSDAVDYISASATLLATPKLLSELPGSSTVIDPWIAPVLTALKRVVNGSSLTVYGRSAGTPLPTLEVSLSGVTGWDATWHDLAPDTYTDVNGSYNNSYTYAALGSGTGKVNLRIKGTTNTQLSVDITINQAVNQPPVVSKPAQDYSFTVGTPVNTALDPLEFTDPDGTIALVNMAGLPPGLGFTSSGRQITGTPTTPGVYNVTITATDNGGATVVDSIVMTVVAAPVTESVPFDVVYADSLLGNDVLPMIQLTKTWITDTNGVNWVTLTDTATPSIPAGYQKYYLVDEDGPVPDRTRSYTPWSGSLTAFGKFPEKYHLSIQVYIAKGTLVPGDNGVGLDYFYARGFAQVFTGTKN